MSRRIGWLVSLMLLAACGDGVADGDCASGKAWTGGNDESPLMNPGQACVACHETDGEAPKLAVAGTVYGVAGEPDNCFGVSSYKVEITDALGMIRTLTTNEAGNFYIQGGSIATPYSARIITPDGTVRQMAAAQTSTDCNACHTVEGANAAPGRL